MKISVLCSSSTHPIYPHLEQWCAEKRSQHIVELVQSKAALSGGDVLFLISCSEIVGLDLRSKYRASLVIHASNLPLGRGWSPLVWQILHGSNHITVSLLEAEDKVDTGAIWHQLEIHFEGHELVDEINQLLFGAELKLMDYAVENIDKVRPLPQTDQLGTYYRRRTPDDSRIDPHRSLAEQFNLLRVCDPSRYPAFFDHLGYRYEIAIKKVGRINNHNQYC